MANRSSIVEVTDLTSIVFELIEDDTAINIHIHNFSGDYDSTKHSVAALLIDELAEAMSQIGYSLTKSGDEKS